MIRKIPLIMFSLFPLLFCACEEEEKEEDNDSEIAWKPADSIALSYYLSPTSTDMVQNPDNYTYNGGAALRDGSVSLLLHNIKLYTTSSAYLYYRIENQETIQVILIRKETSSSESHPSSPPSPRILRTKIPFSEITPSIIELYEYTTNTSSEDFDSALLDTFSITEDGDCGQLQSCSTKSDCANQTDIEEEFSIGCHTVFNCSANCLWENEHEWLTIP